MTEKPAKQEHLLSSVTNALRIMRAFTLEEPEKGIRELAKELALSKSSVQRLVATLSQQGFVVKDPSTQKYRLGVSLLGLSRVVTNHLEIHRESLPVLEKLVEKVGETAHIGILEGTNVVYLHKVETKRPTSILTDIGKNNPPYCTGCGKAILAYQDSEVIEQVISEGLIPYTDKTITIPSEFRDHLKAIKQNGFAVSMGELNEDAVSIAAPVRDYTGHVFAALSIVGPIQRMNSNLFPDYSKEVMRAAMEISENLGYIKKISYRPDRSK
ncbi:IclR family transcriptional regulator [Brevibacillus sp. NRS-1366]|uniref:IclR family transcriptional regulator n=1 Tax=Brevibacillus sp. NRS-1366 TaxID=3233899 RepID=UPI003D1F0580